MTVKLFLAGSTGAIGRALSPLLKAAGYVVYGTTRQPDKTSLLLERGIKPVVIDVFDRGALINCMISIRPDIVVHQLTDLPYGLEPEKMAEAKIRNAYLREVGTQNLVDGAVAAGAGRIVSQSVAWAYDENFPSPYTEDAPLNSSSSAIQTLERLTLETPGLLGTVLRYGLLYGPATGFDTSQGATTVNVLAAAKATLLAIQTKHTGVFNVVEDHGPVSNNKARTVLGWDPALND